MEAASRLREKSNDLQKAEEEKKSLERKIAYHAEELEQLQEELKDRNSRIDILETQMLKFDSSLSEITRSYETLQVEREKLHDSLSRTKEEAGETSEKLRAIADERNQLVEQLKSTRQSLSDEQKKYQECQAQGEAVRLRQLHKIEQLETSLQQSSADLKALQDRSDSLIRDLRDQLCDLNRQFEAETKRYEHNITELASENDELRILVDTLQERAEKNQAGAEAASTKMSLLEEELQQLSFEKDELSVIGVSCDVLGLTFHSR